LVIVCLLLVGCGSQVSERRALQTYLKDREDPSIARYGGKITSTECQRRRGMTYLGAQLYVCTLYFNDHGDVGVMFVCGARVRGQILIEGRLPDCAFYEVDAP